MRKSFPTLVKNPIASAIGFATLTSFASGHVLAQAINNKDKTEIVAEETQQEKDDLAIDRIIVTSTKREMDMQDVAQSIQAFGSEQIERMGLRNFEDYAKAIPGLSSVTTTPGRNQIVFRGISTGGTSEWRTDSSTAVYLDEIPMTSAAQQIDPRMTDIERVEALPGPQGTLLGSSSQSGALRIITNKPDAEHGVFGALEGEVSKVKEGDTSHRVEGHVNLPIIDNTLAVRIAAFSVREGGFIDNVKGKALFTDDTNDDAVEDDFNTWDQDGFRVIGLWHVNDKWDAQLTYLAQKSKTQGDWKYDPAVGELDIVRFHKDVRTDDWWSSALTLTGDLGFAELSLTTSHSERDVFYEFDTMVSDQLRTRAYGIDNINGAYNPTYYNTAYDIGTVLNDQIGRRTTQEIRLASTGEGKFQWLMGAFYETTYDAWDWYYKTPHLTETPAWEAFNNRAYFLQTNYSTGTIYPVAATDRYYGEEFSRTTDQTAVFGEFSYDLSEALTLQVGLRWFEYDRERSERQFWPEGVPFGNYDTRGIDDYKGNDSDFVKKFSVSYDFDDDKMLYFTYSEGFRLGGSNKLRPNSVLPAKYGPDKLFNHELGFKSQWWEDRLRFNIAGFVMRWEDMQREIYDPFLLGVKAHANIGEAESKGIEASFTLQLSPELKLEGSFFKSDAKITKDFYFSQAFEEGVISPDNDWLVATKGQDLAISPDSKYWIGIEYTFDNKFLGANWWLRYDHSYQGKQSHDWWNAQNGYATIPSWTTANFQAGLWTDTDWTVTLTVSNIWDERAINWLDTGNDWLLSQYSIDRYRALPSVVRPREVGITVKYNF